MGLKDVNYEKELPHKALRLRVCPGHATILGAAVSKSRLIFPFQSKNEKVAGIDLGERWRSGNKHT